MLNNEAHFDQKQSGLNTTISLTSQPTTDLSHFVQREGNVNYTESEFESPDNVSKYYTAIFVHIGHRKRDNIFYKCNICGKSQRLLCNFKSHLRTHLNIRPYSCSLCGKTFTTSSNCKMHIESKACHKYVLQ